MLRPGEQRLQWGTKMNYQTRLEWHKDLLVLLAERMQPASYLELGCRTDPTFLYLWRNCRYVTGVDKDPARYSAPSNAKIYQRTTDDFFERIAKGHILIKPPELVFIDACHEARQVHRDFDNVTRIAAPNCLVVFHDTFPESDEYVDPNLCDNANLVPPALVEDGYEIVTLPFPPGVSIARVNRKSLATNLKW